MEITDEAIEAASKDFSIGLFERSKETLLVCLEGKSTQLSPQQSFRAHHLLHLVFRELGQFDEAINALDKARQALADKNSSQPLKDTIVSVDEAKILRLMGDKKTALTILQSIEKRIPKDFIPRYPFLNELATAQIECGMIEDGLATMGSVRDLILANYTAERLGKAYFNFAGLYELCGRNTEAESYYNASLWLACYQGVPELLMRSLNRLASLEMLNGRVDRAFELQNLEINLAECLRDMLPTEQARVTYARRLSQKYVDSLYFATILGHWDRAFELAQGARARSLLDILSPQHTDSQERDSATDSHFELATQQIAFEVLMLEKQGRLSFPASILPQQYIEDTRFLRELSLQQIEVERNRLRSEHLAKFPHHQHGDGDSDRILGEVTTLGSLQSALDSRTMVLEYVATDDKLIVIAVDQSNIHAKVLSTSFPEVTGSAQELAAIWSLIDAEIEGFDDDVALARTLEDREFTSAKSDGKLRDLLSRSWSILELLHESLWEPITEFYDGFERICIIPDHSLFDVPFHALHKDGHSNALDFEFIYAPSASILEICLNRSTSPSKSSAVALSYSNNDLAFTDREVSRLTKAHQSAEFYTGEESTSSAFQKALEEVHTVHIACHFNLNSDSPLESAFVLADGYLSYANLESFSIQANLVVVSACSSGRSVSLPGNEIFGISRSLTKAGVTNSILALWSVVDEAGYHFMAHFYESHKNKDSASSIADAYRKMHQSLTYWHPYFWAPFGLYGSGCDIDTTTPPDRAQKREEMRPVVTGIQQLAERMWAIDMKIEEGGAIMSPPLGGNTSSPQHPIQNPFVAVPGGPFIMGSSVEQLQRVLKGARGILKWEDIAYEYPQRVVYVPGFLISQYPVTNAQYSKFVETTGHRLPEHWNTGTGKHPLGDENLPVVNVDWNDANSYCMWAGLRLPTEEEWEKASRGIDGRMFPWGEEWLPGHANTWDAYNYQAVTVITYEVGASPYGACDMIGNVAEWISNESAAGERRILKGGNWVTDWFTGARCAWRTEVSATTCDTAFGFRTLKDDISVTTEASPSKESPITSFTHDSEHIESTMRESTSKPKWLAICNACGSIIAEESSLADVEKLINGAIVIACACGSTDFCAQRC